MGSDAAPGVEVAGVLQALGAAEDIEVVLVGDEQRVKAEIARAGSVPGRLSVRHAPDVITSDDAPSVAIRHKKQSSMRVCFDLAKAGEADAVVSAGNSGAMLACGIFAWGRLRGVERPAIVTTFPSLKGECALLDMGANVDVRASVLAQFAVLGATYARLRHRMGRPRVGILSNGQEEHKGTALTREAHALLSRTKGDGAAADFDYVGYVEGRDIFKGDVDVIVTDGFTGNVLLKGLEGMVEAVFHMMGQEVDRGGLLVKLGAALMRPALRRFKRRTDYAETGGAPLVGVEGVALICHGGSDARAIKNAVLVAREFARVKFFNELTSAVEKHAFLWDAEPAAESGSGGLPS